MAPLFDETLSGHLLGSNPEGSRLVLIIDPEGRWLVLEEYELEVMK